MAIDEQLAKVRALQGATRLVKVDPDTVLRLHQRSREQNQAVTINEFKRCGQRP